MFADEFLPVYDVSGEVAAEPQVVWEALLGADLVEVGKRTPLAGLLGAESSIFEQVERRVAQPALRRHGDPQEAERSSAVR